MDLYAIFFFFQKMSDIEKKEELKSSMQILSELFKTFDAEPPVIVKKEKHKKSKKKHKHKSKKDKKEKKPKKKSKKRKRSISNSSSSSKDSNSEKKIKLEPERVKSDHSEKVFSQNGIKISYNESNNVLKESNLDGIKTESCKEYSTSTNENISNCKVESIDETEINKIKEIHTFEINKANSKDAKNCSTTETSTELKSETNQSLDGVSKINSNAGKIKIKDIEFTTLFASTIREIEEKHKNENLVDYQVSSESDELLSISDPESIKKCEEHKTKHKHKKHKHKEKRKKGRSSSRDRINSKLDNMKERSRSPYKTGRDKYKDWIKNHKIREWDEPKYRDKDYLKKLDKEIEESRSRRFRSDFDYKEGRWRSRERFVFIFFIFLSSK